MSVLLCMSKSSSKLSSDSPSVFSAMAAIVFLEAALVAVGPFLRVFLVFLGMVFENLPLLLKSSAHAQRLCPTHHNHDAMIMAL